MKWWKQLDSWICIGIFIVTIVFIWWSWKSREGFDVRTIPNVAYPLKEVYLVAPNDYVDGVDIYSTNYPDSKYNLNGYTYKQAQKVCQDLGGDLATFAQVQQALSLGGNWCVKGWMKDGLTTNSIPAYPVYLAQLENPAYNKTCSKTATGIYSTLGSNPIIVNSGGASVTDTDLNNATAFPVCYAPKPANPAAAIQPFSNTSYSWLDATINQVIMTGAYNLLDSTKEQDLFPVVFTQDQVNYALMTLTGAYNPSIYPKTKWDVRGIRGYLISNMGAVNTAIRTATHPSYSDDPRNNSCESLSTIDGDYAIKISTLQRSFKDVSGAVGTAIKSKYENSEIQANIFDICKNLTPTASPACAKLATIDYDIFYKNPTQSVLSDLETLTYNRILLESELCTSIIAVQQVKSLIKCGYTSMASKYCANLCAPGINNCAISTQLAYSSGDSKQYIEFDQNNVEGLKYALTNISPLFTASTYKDILSSAITSLTTVLINPQLIDFSTSNQKMRYINKLIDDIQTTLTAQTSQVVV